MNATPSPDPPAEIVTTPEINDEVPKGTRNIWVNWLSSVPIIFHTIIVVREFFNSIGRCFHEVFVLISVLPGSRFLIKELFEMCVIAMIIF